MKKLISVFSIALLPLTVSAHPLPGAPAHQKVLVITDSHGEGAFGGELVRLLESDGHVVSMNAAGGTIAEDWLLGKQGHHGYWHHETATSRLPGVDVRGMKPQLQTIDQLIASRQPDTVMVELGTNQIWKPFTKKDQIHILSLAKKISSSGARCVWAGAPDLRVDPIRDARARLVNIFLATYLPQVGCKYFPSQMVTYYPPVLGDGIHYTWDLGPAGPAMAVLWANLAYHAFF